MLDIDDAENFPAGLRVLVVDADPTTLLPLERLLLACHYQGLLSDPHPSLHMTSQIHQFNIFLTQFELSIYY